VRNFIAAALLAALTLAAGGAAAETPPDEVIRATVKEVLGVIRERRAELQQNPRELRALIRTRVAPVFDAARIARLILGRHYKTASKRQVADFIREFEDFLIRTYSSAVFEYDRLEITVQPPQFNSKGDKALVKSVVELPARDPVKVHYKMRADKNRRWRIYEVTVNGISLITNYRTIYGKLIEREGLDGLIAQLAAKNRQHGEQ